MQQRGETSCIFSRRSSCFFPFCFLLLGSRLDDLHLHFPHQHDTVFPQALFVFTFTFTVLSLLSMLLFPLRCSQTRKASDPQRHTKHKSQNAITERKQHQQTPPTNTTNKQQPNKQPTKLTRMTMFQSTIYQRHEARAEKHASKSNISFLAAHPVDSSLTETVSQLNRRSTIFQRHQHRQEAHMLASSPSGFHGERAQQQGSQAPVGFSLMNLGSQSTIYRRHARRNAGL